MSWVGGGERGGGVRRADDGSAVEVAVAVAEWTVEGAGWLAGRVTLLITLFFLFLFARPGCMRVGAAAGKGKGFCRCVAWHSD